MKLYIGRIVATAGLAVALLCSGSAFAATHSKMASSHMAGKMSSTHHMAGKMSSHHHMVKHKKKTHHKMASHKMSAHHKMAGHMSAMHAPKKMGAMHMKM